jgi:NAD(P)-dependent dehydrogenase (short-subunit alcohol dehydrogenase family)
VPQNSPWTAEDLPDLSGKTIVVTGASGGLGYQTALELARKGARVVLACRSLARAHEAGEAIADAYPGARTEAMELDLASLSSIGDFARAFLDRYRELHVLCNNAGVLAPSFHDRRTTSDGFEIQLGTNYLGHFALTGHLLERLIATPGARVVSMSSVVYRFGRLRFDDLHREHSHFRWGAYAQSKLANLVFSYELQRRIEAKGASLISVACHPGYALTNLALGGPHTPGSSMFEAILRLGYRLLAQSAASGALPTLYAAAAPGLRGGEFIGPDGFAELRGAPRRMHSNARSHDCETAARLWELSEELTGVRYRELAD